MWPRIWENASPGTWHVLVFLVSIGLTEAFETGNLWERGFCPSELASESHALSLEVIRNVWEDRQLSYTYRVQLALGWSCDHRVWGKRRCQPMAWHCWASRCSRLGLWTLYHVSSISPSLPSGCDLVFHYWPPTVWLLPSRWCSKKTYHGAARLLPYRISQRFPKGWNQQDVHLDLDLCHTRAGGSSLVRNGLPHCGGCRSEIHSQAARWGAG